MYRLLWHLQETAAWWEWIGLLLVGIEEDACGEVGRRWAEVGGGMGGRTSWDEVRLTLTRREDDER